MGIRKITFDNGDIVLAKDQAILYDLLLKQQTKTLLPNGENIYQNSTGFLIQNETEKIKYTYKITDDGVEFTFNPQLYLSVCGRIIKLEENTKLLVDKNYVANNENCYIVIRVDLNKESKIINGELKEFGNPIEIKISNKVSQLIQDNLNQKPNYGIYEFPLISFKAKFKKDINALQTIENIKDESTYLLPLLMESSRNPSKLLTITQKIEEEKENIENYLTDLKYQKIKKLIELEKEILNSSIYLLKNLIQVYPNKNPFKSNDNKFYYVVWKGENNWKIVKFKNNFNRDFAWSQKNLDKDGKYNLFLSVEAIVRQENVHNMPSIFETWNDNSSSVDLNVFKAVYRWDGVDLPDLKIDNNGNIII